MFRFLAATAGVLIWCTLTTSAQSATPPATIPTTQQASPQSATAPSPTYAPTADYEARGIEGWHVLVHRQFLQEHPKTAAGTLELLHFQLYQVVRRLPAPAVESLRKISIWVEFHEGHHPCMVYHPDAGWLIAHQMNPDKARCVEIADARNFLQWTHEQPWMVLHELAHGYHDQFMTDGFENADVLRAYHHAMEAKLYDSVLHIFARHERAYAATNPQEYFAELTEAYFGTNDFFPFVRAELKEHDPVGFDTLRNAWGD